MGAKIVLANHTSPNILFILTDQLRWDTIGIHGNPLDLTPNFDRIALEGTYLINMFTCKPVCTPARACLQTGIYSNLYDLQSDPYELTNLIQLISHQEVTDSLRKRLIQHMFLADEPAPIIESSPEIISNPMRFVYAEEIDG